MGFEQDVGEVAADIKIVKSNWKMYLVAFLAGAVTMLIIIGVIKFIL